MFHSGTKLFCSRLFRRGSRTSLVSLSEEDPKKSHANEHHVDVHPKSEARQLNDLFDLLSTASSNRFEEQRSPPPPSPPPDDGGGKDLDDIFDLMTSINSDRIDDQRTPGPTPTKKSGAVSPDKLKKKKKVAKYFLPTGSPFLQRKSHLNRTGAMSPPTSSMPDLTVEDEGGGYYYAIQSSSSTPSCTRSRLASDKHHSGHPGPRSGLSGHAYFSLNHSAINGEHVRNNSFSSSDSHHTDGGGHLSTHFTHRRNRAQTFDSGTSYATDPTARRRLQVHNNWSHEQSVPSSLVRSVPSVGRPPPTSPLATTAYSSNSRDAFNTDNEESPFFSHRHTQSTSTTNTASQSDEMGDASFQYQHTRDDLHGSSGFPDSFHQGIPTASIPLDMARSLLLAKKFKAKSEENLQANGDDIGTFDLFRAASEGDLKQSSSPPASPPPSKCKVEENSYFQFKQSSQQPANGSTKTNGGTSITMMHCNYHSIYPEEEADPPRVEPDFTSYSSRARSVSSTVEPPSIDGCYDLSRRRSETPSGSSYDPQLRKNGGLYVNANSPRRYSADQRYHRNPSNSSESSSTFSQTLSSPTGKITGSGVRKSSDASSLLFSATLGFSDMLHSGSRDRLPSQPQNGEEHAEM